MRILTVKIQNRTVLIGDVMDKIKEIPDNTVDCVISSPPYWALRDYGTGKWVNSNNPSCEHASIRRKTRAERKSNQWMEQKLVEGTFGDEPKWTSKTCPECNAEFVDQQWGMESDFKEYLEKLRKLMNELRRVVKKTGTIWINLGDTYSSSGSGTNSKTTGLHGKDCQCGSCVATHATSYYRKNMKYIQTKSRVGIPERFYINCIDDGWVARNHIPWIKPNAMPSSVQDRFTNKWESVFFFAKNQKYYFNLDAVREKTITTLKPPKEKTKDQLKPFLDDTEIQSDRKMVDVPGQQPHSIHLRREQGLIDYEEKGNHQPEGRSHFGTGSDIKQNMLKAQFKQREANKAQDQFTQRILEKRAEGAGHDNPLGNPAGKNPGDVFEFDESDAKWMKHYDENGNCLGCGKHYSKHSVKNRAQGSENRDQRQKVDYVWCNASGKNPGDVIYNHEKPYAVVERYGEVIFRKLPEHDSLRMYLTDARIQVGLTIDSIEEYFETQAGHHWFEKDGSYPSVSDWIILKKLLKLDDSYDDQLLTEYTKPAEKQNDPRGKNPGDVFIINTKPFNNAHFATFNIELPLKILKCACPQEICKKCGVPKQAIWKRSSLQDTTDACELAIEQSQYKLGKSSALRLSGGGDTFNAWKAENPDEIIGFTNCGCNEGYEPGIVLDPFFGSGTVGVAAEKLGLNWIGIEINPEYVSDIITKRLDKHKNERMNDFF